MTNAIQQFDYMKLSVDDRIQLAQNIWDSVVAEGLPLPIPDSHKQILDQRLAEHLAAPDDVVDWDEVKRDADDG